MGLEYVLVVEDDDNVRDVITRLLVKQGYRALGVRSLQQAREAVQREPIEVLLSDMRLPDGDGLEFLRQMRQEEPAIHGVLMTGFATMESAVEGVRAGLADYLIKPIHPGQLDITMKRLESLHALFNENRYLRQEQQGQAGASIIWGNSPMMQEIRRLVERVAATEATVLILGESGTGKEVIARTLRDLSARADAPFVRVNCAAVPDTLLESEFFGHEKGAFTGAVQRREGRFETATGGTLLLDEIAEIPLSLQTKLLRVLQEREFERVGGNQTIRVNVRLIASTNRDLQKEVADGRFREDLYYRLNVVPLHLPPLRLRGDDLELLATEFLQRAGRRHGKRVPGLADEAWVKLKAYRWPGNIRELQNVIERAVILGESKRPLEAHELALPEEVRDQWSPDSPWVHATELPTLAVMERRLIGAALLRTQNNRTHAAKRLGISLRTMRNKLAAYREQGFDTEKPDSLTRS